MGSSIPTRQLSPAQSAGRFAGLLTVLAVVDLIDQKDIVKGFARCAVAQKGWENVGKWGHKKPVRSRAAL